MNRIGGAFLIFFLFLALPATAGIIQEPCIMVTVEQGDCLIAIGERYLENPEDWRKIARLNELKNPHLIYPGQTVLLPVALLRGEPIEGTVRFLRGDAEIQQQEGSDWRRLLLNDRIREGDKVKTGGDSTLEVQFENGDILNQRADTIVNVMRARKKGNVFFHQFFLKAGKTVTNIQKATGRESRFTIDTPAAVCAARGTEFRTSVDASEVTRSEVLDGMIDVEAVAQSITVVEGEGTLVKKGEPPQIPRKLLPPPEIAEKKTFYKKMPLEFGFREIKGAVSYRVVIARDREMRDVLGEQLIKPDALFSIARLDDDTYYVQSQSIDEEGLEGLSSSPEEVVVRVNPVPPYIQYPAEGAEYRETEMSFSWLNVKDAAAYHLQTAEDREFSAVVHDRRDIRDTGYRAGPFDYKSYYFRVRSIAEDGYEGEWSDTIHFAVIPPPPVPQMDRPAVGGKTISVRWPDLGAGYTYHFQMSGDTQFSSILVDDLIEEPSIILERPDRPGVYFVRTSSIDSRGYEGHFSEPQSFEIKRGLFLEFLGITGLLGLIFLLL